MSDTSFLYEKPPGAALAELPGIDYLQFLAELGHYLQPSSYLEIGTNSGASLQRIQCDALCIDPEFNVEASPLGKRRRSLFFQMPSDAFFAQYEVRSFFPAGVDLAFLDGMHWFEFLLRDFINTERACHPRSLILLHDCLPQNLRMAERVNREDPQEDARTRYNWTGDVWRMLPILKMHRPDLQVRILDCPPTGLVAVSRLDPQNDVLSRAYHTILEEFAALELEAYGIAKLRTLFPMLETRAICRPEVLTSVFTIR